MKNTKIQWTDSTVNFWIGCDKVSAGCLYCYMFREMARFGKNPNLVQRTSDAIFYQATKWEQPQLIFTNSWSDFFHPDADRWRSEAWNVIRQTPQHKWQILTKRPERIMECLPADWGSGWKNVWLGTSIERMDSIQRAEILSQIPAQVRFISAEPLLGPLDLVSGNIGTLIKEKFQWVILGGESGNESGKYRYRPCELEWIEQILHDLAGTDVKPFVKQLGTYQAKRLGLTDRHGGKIEQWPEQLQIRLFPDDYYSH